jgi:hypothetical protein
VLAAVLTAAFEGEVRATATSARGKGRKAQLTAPVTSTGLMTPAAALDLLSACDTEAFTQPAVLPVRLLCLRYVARDQLLTSGFVYCRRCASCGTQCAPSSGRP